MAPDHALPDSVESVFTQAIAPLHRSALGAAVGATAGAGVLLLTAFHIVFDPPHAANIELLSQFFFGYRVTWTGAFIGACWAGVTGFVAGLVFAFARNLIAATWLLIVRVKSELFQTREFLDHI